MSSFLFIFRDVYFYETSLDGNDLMVFAVVLVVSILIIIIVILRVGVVIYCEIVFAAWGSLLDLEMILFDGNVGRVGNAGI